MSRLAGSVLYPSMWPYYPDLLSRPVPRYTSYPTAAEFHADVGTTQFAKAMSELDGPVSLYVHLPFCQKICWYCGCNTSAANHALRITTYLDALYSEIKLVSALLPSVASIKRVSLGGGSPNALRPIDFVRLIDVLTIHFNLDDPILSVELDPRSLGRPWGEVLAGIGVKRASLGVQTFSPDIQRRIGREQPVELVEDCVHILREAGVESLNLDLMYGLPGQTLDEADSSLTLASRLGADRLALFGYAHVPHLIPRQRRIVGSELPGVDLRFQMATLGFDRLHAEGYTPIGFDHFARPGDPLAQAALRGNIHRNFQGFTDDDCETVIGLGASAISTFPRLIVQNEKNTGRYRMQLSQGRLAQAVGVSRSDDDRERGRVIEDILCQGRARLSERLLSDALTGLLPFLDRGLATIERSELSLASSGLPYVRAIAAQFDAFRTQPASRFSSAL